MKLLKFRNRLTGDIAMVVVEQSSNTRTNGLVMSKIIEDVSYKLGAKESDIQSDY